MRIDEHPILGTREPHLTVQIEADGEVIQAVAGEPIAAALLAAGRSVFRYTRKRHEARGVFCAIGRCTDCMMIVDGVPNVRTCITPVKAGMKVQTQHGLGEGHSAVRYPVPPPGSGPSRTGGRGRRGVGHARD